MDQNPKQDKVEQLVIALEKVYQRPGLIMWRGFLLGLFSGLGATIGVALVLGILGMLIRQFGGLPIVGDWLNGLDQILPKR